MFARMAMTFLGVTGIAFYVRFLVGLWKESKPRSSGCWVRLRLGSAEPTLAELPLSLLREWNCWFYNLLT
jgi:hypothetical protein